MSRRRHPFLDKAPDIAGSDRIERIGRPKAEPERTATTEQGVLWERRRTETKD